MEEQNREKKNEEKRTAIYLENKDEIHRNGLAWLLKWSDFIRLIDWTIECKQIESLFNRNECSQLNNRYTISNHAGWINLIHPYVHVVPTYETVSVVVVAVVVIATKPFNWINQKQTIFQLNRIINNNDSVSALFCFLIILRQESSEQINSNDNEWIGERERRTNTKRVTSTLYLKSVCVVKVVANRCLRAMLIIQC